MNAADDVIQGYPPVGGHAREDDVDYVGNHSHHAKHPTMTDHLFCTVVTAPATVDCSAEFATGGSLMLYADPTYRQPGEQRGPSNHGGTGSYAGYSGTAIQHHHRKQQQQRRRTDPAQAMSRAGCCPAAVLCPALL